jgi:hypothetical protein
VYPVLRRAGNPELQYAGRQRSSNASSTLPIGWGFSEAGTGNNITYAASDGSLSTPNTYSFGTGTSTDRAFGEITGALQSTLGTCIVNASGSPIISFLVGYTGEQWRRGDTAGPVDRLDFQYSTTATALNSGTYIDVSALDFATPNTGALTGAVNGNSAANRTVIFAGSDHSCVADPARQYILHALGAPEPGGNNDGLAIDDWSFDGLVHCNLDLDLNGTVDPLTDGLMLMRGMMGLTGSAVTSGALGPTPHRTSWSEMASHLNAVCGTNFAP